MNTDMLPKRPKIAASVGTVPCACPEASHFVPLRMLEIEVGQPLTALSAFDEKTNQWYRRARCLIRLHTQPLGELELELEGHEVSAGEYAPRIWQAFGARINEHLQRDALPTVTGLDASGLSSHGTPACLEEREKFAAHAPFASVIVSTRDRPQRIQSCVQALLALDYPHYEIIVVDNAPSTSATADFIEQAYRDVPQVRYVREDRPGLSRARNCGMMAAKGEILAFTDDDVIIDRYWLIELVRDFYIADNVACVTGLVLPLELETHAQSLLEEYGGFSKGFTRRIFDMRENHPRTPLYPYTAGCFGSGASLAFRATFLRSIGGFDAALGTGRPARGGEDLAIFFQVVTRGYTLVYEPAALLYHPHHRDYSALRKQIYSYGIGLTAYLTEIVLAHPRLVIDILPKLLYGLAFAVSPASPKNRKKSAQYPKELTTIELKGMLYGPFAYVYSRLTTRDGCKD